jgi:hypothetical protein
MRILPNTLDGQRKSQKKNTGPDHQASDQTGQYLLYIFRTDTPKTPAEGREG